MNHLKRCEYVLSERVNINAPEAELRKENVPVRHPAKNK